MKKIQITSVLVVLVLSFGCANITHRRDYVNVTPQGVTNRVHEVETGRFFLSKESAQKLSLSTRDQGSTNYSHNLSVTGAQMSGDSEMLKTFFDGAANVTKSAVQGALQGAK